MSKTRIEWSEFVWNPVTGCTPCSPGCAHCFAERMARRLAGRYGYPEAPHHFDVILRPDRLDIPLKRKKPTLYFVCSMSDLFHPDVPFRYVSSVWGVMASHQRHAFQVLTKRPKRMLEFLNVHWKPWVYVPKVVPVDYCNEVVLPNVWLGVSVENQAAADERREDLRQCPAAVKYVSYEPALGPVDWTGWEFVSQIISGGESGPNARPSHPDWHRATRDFCQENEIAYFMKQWGTWFPRSQWEHSPEIVLPDDDYMTGNDIYYFEGGETMHRVGKKRAGRLLDGRTWQQFPRMPKGDI